MSRRAASLLEVLVASAISLLLLGVVVLLFYATSRASQRTQASIQLQETGLIAMDRLLRDLQTSSAGAMALAEDGVAPWRRCLLALQPQSQHFSIPQRSYEMKIVGYEWNQREGTLRRKLWEPPLLPVALNASEPTRLTPAQLLSLRFTGAATLAREVVEFQVQSPVDLPNIGNPLVVFLKLQRNLPGKRPVDFQLRNTIYLRNSSH